MPWVHRAPESTPTHRCQQPTRWDTAPTAEPDAPPVTAVPDGNRGDLWRCDCAKLWRIARCCDIPGRCPTGGCDHPRLVWDRATWWQMWRHRKP